MDMATHPAPRPASDDGFSRQSDELIHSLVEIQRQIHQLEALKAKALAKCWQLGLDHADKSSPGEFDLALRSITADAGAALRVNDRTMNIWMSRAHDLAQAYPDTIATLGKGEISLSHAHVVQEFGQQITKEEHRQAYEEIVLRHARKLSVNRLRPIARRTAARFLAKTLTQRHQDAVKDRRVWLQNNDDGMATLGAELPAAQARGILDRLTSMALQQEQNHANAEKKEKGLRTIDQLRADIFSDLLLTSQPTAHAGGNLKAHVQVVVPVLRLLEQEPAYDVAEPAELAGYGPIDIATVRELVGQTRCWDRLLTHPITGTLLAVDRYRPSQELVRFLQARDQHCRFPGCRQPAQRCDIDHTVAASDGGPTSATNLAHLCRRHHTLKHHSAWTVKQLPDGVLKWVSPSGRSYQEVPVSFQVEPPQKPSGDHLPRFNPWTDDPSKAPSINDPPF